MANEPTKAPSHTAAPKPTPADQMAADKAALTAENAARQKATAEREKNRGTPTPTQEECDLMKLGHHPELANDGSGPDPNAATSTVKHLGAKPGGGYDTRAMAPKPA